MSQEIKNKQEKILLTKYKITKLKKQKAFVEGNAAMYTLYSRDLKTIRMVLSTLNIHIDGINR